MFMLNMNFDLFKSFLIPNFAPFNEIPNSDISLFFRESMSDWKWCLADAGTLFTCSWVTLLPIRYKYKVINSESEKAIE